MSSVFPDLNPARGIVESMMVDRCVVRRPSKAVEVFDEETGDVTTGEAPVIYGPDTLGDGDRPLEGRCIISERSNNRDQETTFAGVDMKTISHVASIPWDAPELLRDDELEVVSSARDPQLVGTELTVRATSRKTMLVTRKIALERH